MKDLKNRLSKKEVHSSDWRTYGVPIASQGKQS